MADECKDACEAESSSSLSSLINTAKSSQDRDAALALCSLERHHVRGWLGATAYQHLLCLSYYQFPWQHWILRWKFHDDLTDGALLCQLFAHAAATYYRRITANGCFPDQIPAAICFVPTSTARFAQRGFNPAEMLARALATAWQRPVVDAFYCTAQSKTQVGANRRQRLRQASQRFGIKAQPTGWPTSMLLVDDVITTGATVQCLARLLLQQGVKQITVACLCLTAPSHDLG
jgi:ComF family protein